MKLISKFTDQCLDEKATSANLKTDLEIQAELNQQKPIKFISHIVFVRNVKMMVGLLFVD